MTEQERLAAGLRYLEQQKKADPLESFRSLEGLKGVYERRVQPIINNAMQTFETGGAVGDLLRAYGSAAAPANAAVLEGMGMPYRGPMTAPRQEGVSGVENFRVMGDPRQQAVGQMIGDPANLVQPVGARLANALKFAKPDAMKMVQEMSRGAISPMDVWHGTPHRFPPTAKNPLGEFDPTKIGSGEGAQAYGYGHYLAEAPGVASTYKLAGIDAVNLVDRNGSAINLAMLPQPLQKALNANIGAPDLLSNARRFLANKTNQEYYAEKYGAKSISDAVKTLEDLNAAGVSVRDSGQLYKIDLPDEVVPRMLDWDKPLSQQHPDVQAALKKLGISTDKEKINQFDDALLQALQSSENVNLPKQPINPIGADIYSKFVGGGNVMAAQKLREAGIPGIQYLDAGSRGASTGTRNFVVFPGNEGLLNILGRE